MSTRKIISSGSGRRVALRSSALAAAATAALFSLGSVARAQTMTPINATGWNVNNVFSSNGNTPSASFDANNGYNLYTSDAPGAPAGTGLPTSNNNTFTSAANPNTTFQFQPYSSNNALELNNNSTSNYGPGFSTSATLTLATPGKYSNLAFLNADANGPTTVSYTVNFAGGATASGSFEGQDWYNGTGVAINNIGRISTGYTSFVAAYPQYASYYYQTGAQPQLYETDIAIPTSDQLLNIDSITFSIPSSGALQFNLYGVSGSQATIPFYIYTGATSHVWDTSTPNFSLNGSSTSFANGGAALFDDTAGSGSNIVSIAAGGVSPGLTVFNNSSSSYTINGPGGITGTGTLEVDGGGTVTLNTSNTYTGATAVNNGTLIVGSTGKIASGEIDVVAGSTFTVNSGGALTSTSLVLNDSGTVNYNGTALSVGTLSGAGTLNLKGTALTITQGGNFSGGIIDTSTGASLTVNMPAANTLSLTGSNTYSGGTFLTSGSLLLGNSGSIGSGPLVLQGGLVGAAGTDVNLTNVISGSALIVGGTNLLEISNSGNTFAGPVVVQSGTLQIDGAASLGHTTQLIVASGASFSVNDTSGTAGAGTTILISGTGPNLTNSTDGFNGPSGALRGADNVAAIWAGNVNVSGPSYIVPGASTGAVASLTLTGSISGNGPVIFTGNPDDTYSGATIIVAPSAGNTSTYTGETQLVGEPNPTAGTTTLELGGNNALSTAAGLNIVAGTAPQSVIFDMEGYNQTVAYLAGAAQNGYEIANSGSNQSVLTINSSSTSASGTAINGNVAVVKSGSGNQTLTGNSSYIGGTTVAGGTLTIPIASALGSGPVKLTGGTLALSAPSVISGFNGFVTNGPNATVLSNTTLQLTNVVAGGYNETSSAYAPTPVNISDARGFTASFTYNPTPESYGSEADGATFIIQNNGTSAIGGGGGSWGYLGISKSFALIFDIYYGNNNIVPGQFVSESTGGVAPTTGNSYAFYDFGSDPIGVTITYANGIVTETLTDPGQLAVNYNSNSPNYGQGNPESVTYTYPVDIAQALGGAANGSSSGYVGFTAAGGGVGATQQFSNFSFNAGGATPVALSNPVIGASGISYIQVGTQSGANTETLSGGLNIASGAVVHLTSAQGSTGVLVLTTPMLSIAGHAGAWTGQLDIGSGDLILPGASLSTITSMVKQGYSNGTWTGNGITSSAAAGDSKHLTAVGVIVNDNPLSPGTPLYGNGGGLGSTFDGAATNDGDILVKYTYYGDANLDGAVDGTDYALVDATYLAEKFVNGVATNPISGWYNGDFNYDGVVDGSDYTLMDNAFNQQGISLGSNPAALLATATAQVAGTSAVPEPATLGVLAFGAVGLLSRRRHGITSR
jgi:fibronectin-binding autotransporter adhesin